MPATSRLESAWASAAAASASGKLAPHSSAAGRIAQRQRTTSIWNVYHGLVESSGFTGHQGRELASCHADHAIAAAKAIWLHPSNARGCQAPRASIAPTLDPTASPTRKTARMIEKV